MEGNMQEYLTEKKAREKCHIGVRPYEVPIK